MHDWKKYTITFFLTATLFSSAFYLSNYFSDKRLKQIEGVEQKISLDLLSSETQFDLLSEVTCKDIDTTILSSELNTLAERLTFLEGSTGANNEELIYLKKYYSLLQIKDYLLSKRLSEKCGTKTVFIIYLYADKESCKDCETQGYVLTEIRDTYPDLRVYSFDYNLDLQAIKTMLSLYKVEGRLPAIVVQGTPEYGFKTVEEVASLLPKELREKASASKATTTKR